MEVHGYKTLQFVLSLHEIYDSTILVIRLEFIIRKAMSIEYAHVVFYVIKLHSFLWNLFDLFRFLHEIYGSAILVTGF